MGFVSSENYFQPATGSMASISWARVIQEARKIWREVRCNRSRSQDLRAYTISASHFSGLSRRSSCLARTASSSRRKNHWRSPIQAFHGSLELSSSVPAGVIAGRSTIRLTRSSAFGMYISRYDPPCTCIHAHAYV